jgi:hypothetical protein
VHNRDVLAAVDVIVGVDDAGVLASIARHDVQTPAILRVDVVVPTASVGVLRAPGVRGVRCVNRVLAPPALEEIQPIVASAHCRVLEDVVACTATVCVVAVITGALVIPSVGRSAMSLRWIVQYGEPPSTVEWFFDSESKQLLAWTWTEDGVVLQAHVVALAGIVGSMDRRPSVAALFFPSAAKERYSPVGGS